MQPNPFSGLIHSRKFWLLILDTIISLVLYFVSKYIPGAAEDVKFAILALQPVFVTIILAVAWEDTALVKINGQG
jgi:uncharacterized membrane protein HdeD (DUF308 family)